MRKAGDGSKCTFYHRNTGFWTLSPPVPPTKKNGRLPPQGMKKLSHIDSIDHTLTTGKFSQTYGSQAFKLSIHSLFRSEKKKFVVSCVTEKHLGSSMAFWECHPQPIKFALHLARFAFHGVGQPSASVPRAVLFSISRNLFGHKATGKEVHVKR